MAIYDTVSALKPQVGIMIEHPAYEQARSIRHCCYWAGTRRMGIEQKYNGEYCQVHINLNAPEACIRIFSTSERDSTRDRIGLHREIRDSLELGTSDCKIKEQCILHKGLLQS